MKKQIYISFWMSTSENKMFQKIKIPIGSIYGFITFNIISIVVRKHGVLL